MSKTRQTAEQHPWNPELRGQYTSQITDCKSGEEILGSLKSIESEMGVIPDIKQFTFAIRKAASLSDYSTSFRIFETAKELQRVDVSLYTLMIWVCAQQRTVQSLTVGMDLFVEMQEVYSLTPSISIYNQLLSLCVKTREFGRGKAIWKDLNLQKKADDAVTPDISSYNIMMDLHCKSGSLDRAVAMFEGLQNGKYFDLRPNYHIFTTLITAFSELQKIETAEKLFHRAMRSLYVATAEHNAKHQKEILILTQCLLNGYANIGNVDRCVDVVTNVIDRNHPQYVWTHFPAPNVPMFTSVLKACYLCSSIPV